LTELWLEPASRSAGPRNPGAAKSQRSPARNHNCEKTKKQPRRGRFTEYSRPSISIPTSTEFALLNVSLMRKRTGHGSVFGFPPQSRGCPLRSPHSATKTYTRPQGHPFADPDHRISLCQPIRRALPQSRGRVGRLLHPTMRTGGASARQTFGVRLQAEAPRRRCASDEADCPHLLCEGSPTVSSTVRSVPSSHVHVVAA
jgi:hypothetical protein